MEQASVTVQEARRAREMTQTASTLREQVKTAQEAHRQGQEGMRSLLQMIRAGGPAMDVVRQRITENLEREEAQQTKRARQRDRGMSR